MTSKTKNITSYNIRELKINIRSNIIKDNGDDYHDFEFTRDNIHLPDKGQSTQSQKILNIYPYFTYSFKYPRNTLLNLSMRKRIEFFFNLDKFVELLVADNNKTENTEEPNTMHEITQYNIMLMIESLFPTQFPIYNNIKDSHSYYINGDRGINKHMFSMITNPFNQPFSYTNHNGKIYTTRRAIWVNDILNHSIYKAVFDKWIDVTKNKNSTSTKTRLMNYIKTISNSKLSMTYRSLNKKCQQIWDHIIENNSPSQQFDSIRNITNIYFEPTSTKIDIITDNDSNDIVKNMNMNTGVLTQQINNATYFYIELAIDYFQGEINHNNKKKYACNFVSNYLGDLFEKIVQTNTIINQIKWNIDFDRPSLYQPDNSASIKRNNTIEYNNNNQVDSNDINDKYKTLFNEIIEYGSNTKKYIEYLNTKNRDIDMSQIYQVYLEYVSKKSTNYMEGIYAFINKRESRNVGFLITKVKELHVKNISSDDGFTHNIKFEEKIRILEKYTDNNDIAMLIHFIADDIIQYIKDENIFGGSSGKRNKRNAKTRRKKKKEKLYNYTIKKNLYN